MQLHSVFCPPAATVVFLPLGGIKSHTLDLFRNKTLKQPVFLSIGEKCPSLLMGKAVGNSDVWFRFNEGMSNAVRRNVYIRELL